MSAPKAIDIGTRLEELDAAIKLLEAERKDCAETARGMLDRNIKVHGPTKEYYLCPTTRTVIAAGILEDKRLAKNIREQLPAVDVTKAKKLREAGLIPDESWAEYATETKDFQMRSKDLKPATADRKAEVL